VKICNLFVILSAGGAASDFLLSWFCVEAELRKPKEKSQEREGISLVRVLVSRLLLELASNCVILSLLDLFLHGYLFKV
jgi:hypothetical protein